jgi:hypothetical protein
MAINLQVSADSRGVSWFASAIRQAVVSAKTGPMRDAYVQAAARYLTFIRRRFNELSRSGGSSEWPDLALSTKVARLRARKGSRAKLKRMVKAIPTRRKLDKAVGSLELSGTRFSILRDTSVLFNSLTQGSPGNVSEPMDDGIRVGTIVNYATYHQNPTTPGRPPQRKILVPPDAATMEAIKRALRAGLTKALKAAQPPTKGP